MSESFPFEHFLNLPENKKQTGSLFKENQLLKADAAPSEDTGFNVEELDFINTKILDALKDQIPEVKFNTFFNESLTLVNIHYGLVEFSTSTDYIKTVINNNYLEDLKKAVKSVLGKDYEIKVSILNFNDASSHTEKESRSAKDASFQIDLVPNAEDKKDKVESKVINHMSDSKFKFVVDPKKTFENFVVGPSNNMAYASAMAVAKNPGKVYPSLYLHSNSGLGKTHLLHAAANIISEGDPSTVICITTARDFMTEMIDAVANKKIAEFRRKYSESIDVLMIDDVHELKNKQGTQNEFFHVFNELHNKGKQLIFTSDKHPKDIDGIEERIKTRLSWGLVLDIHQPDLETRIAILKKKAAEEDIYLPEDVINLIATSIKSNIRELEGSLIRLAAYASVFNVDIDVEIAKEQLNLGNIREQDFLTIESVTKTVSQYFKVPVADIKSKTRIKEVAAARHIAMYLIYNLVKPTPTYVEIAKYFGGRDHTSVLHGVEKIRRNSKINQQLSQTLLEIENSL